MATNTYVALDKQTLVSAASSVTFTSIPSTYTDLRIVYSSTASADATNYIRFNSDSTTNYSNTGVYGNGTAAGSNKNTSDTGIFGPFTMSSNQTVNIIDVFNYANATTCKSVLIKAGAANNSVLVGIGLWRKTPETISSISIFCSSANFSAGSSFALYGIKAWSAEETPKATGGYVYSDSTYWYHAFPFSSTFTPNQSITADVLVVAGGGGGAHGGGGAGGVAYYASQSLTATEYTCTIGAGGTGGPASHATRGTSGANSQFASLTAAVGGGAGGQGAVSYSLGLDGGSGGGGAPAGAIFAGGSATSGQGYAGGTSGAASGTYSAGGGGGAGAVGANGNSSGGLGGAGGVGTSTYSSWGVATNFGHNVAGTYFFAGGGSGGSDGGITPGSNGGGGQGSVGATTPGQVSTGAGGGGSSNVAGSAGGSGIIIVRYAK